MALDFFLNARSERRTVDESVLKMSVRVVNGFAVQIRAANMVSRGSSPCDVAC